ALGAYAVSFQTVDVFILLVIGVLGFFMRRYGYPVAPLVVGMILGPMGEEYLRKALQQSQGNVGSLFLHPFAATAYAVLAVLIIGGLWLKKRRSRYEAAMEQALTSEIAVVAAAEIAGLAPGHEAEQELDQRDRR
ncbi:MAG: tripartite tricarboxylate transporter permease, partial [Microbacterium sp.]|uniref:tripartite tricarboxylate transporter permease n=1 Tax=Microbacterium sp. TaxID=51671 RepID=UPI003F814D54